MLLNDLKRLVIYCPYPLDEAPSQRFRFEQYLHLLKKQGVKITVLTFYNQSAWKILYSEDHHIRKAVCILFALLKRFFSLIKVFSADRILIHREILPIGPPILEWGIARLLNKKIIYDFDDAIWLTDNIKESWLHKTIRWRSKVRSICRWSYVVSVGNEYLAGYARQFNPNVVVNPTTIDTVNMHNRSLYKPIQKLQYSNEIVIGWTGSHTTLKYLKTLESALVDLESQFPNVSFLIIADEEPDLLLERIQFRPWSKTTEVSDLLLVDVGIMPLPNDEWTKGKCGFKALQYMALEIPCVASPVGVNTQIIQPGNNGFLCYDEKEWLECITKLIHDSYLRKEIGRAGRKTIEAYYSITSNTPTFLSLFEK
jgi:glycosyltransferase involved in cell wall biosynthesis